MLSEAKHLAVTSFQAGSFALLRMTIYYQLAV
jgi:hypothetical protein